MKFFVLSCLAALALLIGCAPEQPDRQQPEQTASSVEALEPVFDDPALLAMTATQIRQRLGEPETEFQPNAEQRQFDVPATVEFKRGTTTLAIDYGSDDAVREMFLSDNTTGRTAAELYQLGTMDESGTSYSTNVQPWANPALARCN